MVVNTLVTPTWGMVCSVTLSPGVWTAAVHQMMTGAKTAAFVVVY